MNDVRSYCLLQPRVLLEYLRTCGMAISGATLIGDSLWWCLLASQGIRERQEHSVAQMDKRALHCVSIIPFPCLCCKARL